MEIYSPIAGRGKVFHPYTIFQLTFIRGQLWFIEATMDIKDLQERNNYIEACCSQILAMKGVQHVVVMNENSKKRRLTFLEISVCLTVF